MEKAAIGVVGLGVMGQSLALNMERNGYAVAGYELDKEKMKEFLEGKAAGKNIFGVDSPAELMASLEKPRRILLMVPAGKPVDSAIDGLKGEMEPGDILIDGGNSFFKDTEQRSKELEKHGLNFVGMGVSGGEEGALWGPSMMPGGQVEAWQALKPILEAIAAKAEDGAPCVAHMGPRGAGHFVKMVHNGIEYADMQLIAEVYDFLHRGLGLNNQELHQVFSKWNEGDLKSYLIEITADIFLMKDPKSSADLIDMILDEAKQKGTGKWTSQIALDIGAPTQTINAAVESRIISGLKEERVAASKIISGPSPVYQGKDREKLIAAAQDALLASKITAYAQGMGMLSVASKEFDYDLDLKSIASIWRAGCIIRAKLLEAIMTAYDNDPGLVNLLLDKSLREAVESRQSAWRLILSTGIGLGIPLLAMGSALSYFDAYRSERLPANLTQAQRDYFGAHTYRRIDQEGVFHTEWSE